MEKKEKRYVALIVIGIVIVVALSHLDIVLSVAGFAWSLVLPVVIGLVTAFILDVPVSGFEKLFHKMTAKKKKPPKDKTIHVISIVLTILCVLLILALLCTLVIPELVRTVRSISAMVKEHWPEWSATLISILEDWEIDTTAINEFISTFDFGGAIEKIASGAGNLIGSITSITTSTVTAVSSAVIGIIIAVYMLLDRNTLIRQGKKMLYAYAKPAAADKACYVCALLKDYYSKFLSGQCLESVILGAMIFIFFTIFRLPYAGLIGVVTAICALIPYIGAFISCALGVVLALMNSPEKALLCLIVYLAVQFIETQFIYPHVVGGSVGLSPLWTLISVLIGGNLLGILGMIFFIPLVSVIYTLIKEDTDKRLEQKKKDAVKTT